MKTSNASQARVASKTNQPLIETLEGRMLFDLVPTVVGSLPTSLVATVKNKDVVTVDLTNTAATPVTGAFTVSLFASTSQIFGAATDTPVGAPLSKTVAHLGAGVTKGFPIKLGAFPDVANGNYYILAEVTGSLAGVADNTAASTATIAIADPFIDLTDSVTVLKPATFEVLPGKTYELGLEVINNGNVPAIGTIVADVSTSSSSDGSSPSDPVTVKLPIRLAANGGHKTYPIIKQIPFGFTPGTYFFEATVDPANTLGESNISNNSAISSNTLTVLDPYPNLLGTFTGPGKVIAGTDKHAVFGLTLTFATESNTDGDVTGTGIDVTESSGTVDFNFTGTVTTRGALLLHGRVSTFKARLVHGTLIGTVVNSALADTSTYILTIED